MLAIFAVGFIMRPIGGAILGQAADRYGRKKRLDAFYPTDSASAFLIESAPALRRAFAGSWQWFAINAGTMVSFLLGFGLASLGSDAALNGWGWRVAFIIAALIGAIALWIRLSVRET